MAALTGAEVLAEIERRLPDNRLQRIGPKDLRILFTDVVSLIESRSAPKQIELGTSETHIQWRYSGEAWSDLLPISLIVGPTGPPFSVDLPNPVDVADVTYILGSVGGQIVWVDPATFGSVPAFPLLDFSNASSSQYIGQVT